MNTATTENTANEAVRSLSENSNGRAWNEGGWGRCWHDDGREIRQTREGWVIRTSTHSEAGWMWLNGEPEEISRHPMTGRAQYAYPPTPTPITSFKVVNKATGKVWDKGGGRYRYGSRYSAEQARARFQHPDAWDVVEA